MCNAQLTEPHETVLRLVYSASSVNLVGCRIGCDAEIFLLFLPDEFSFSVFPLIAHSSEIWSRFSCLREGRPRAVLGPALLLVSDRSNIEGGSKKYLEVGQVLMLCHLLIWIWLLTIPTACTIWASKMNSFCRSLPMLAGFTVPQVHGQIVEGAI